jgi:hypothetical protein
LPASNFLGDVQGQKRLSRTSDEASKGFINKNISSICLRTENYFVRFSMTL